MEDLILDIFSDEDAIEIPNKKEEIKKEKPAEEVIIEEEVIEEEIPETPKEDVQEIEKSDISSTYYQSAIEYIERPIDDKDWLDFKENLKTKIDKIKIKSTLTPNLILPIISELDGLYSIAYEEHVKTKTALQNLTNKEDGMLTVCKTINAKGSNESERKSSGMKAAQKYKLGNKSVDLFELVAETRSRYYFLESILEQIKFKKDLLILVSSSFKTLNA